MDGHRQLLKWVLCLFWFFGDDTDLFSKFLDEFDGLLVPRAYSFNGNGYENVCVGYVGVVGCLQRRCMVDRGSHECALREGVDDCDMNE